jgi:hypothetical protein
VRGDVHRGLGEHEIGTEQPGLLDRADGEVVAADATLEAQVVADQRAGPGLTSRDVGLEDHRLQALRRGVHRCGQARRPGPDDDDVAAGRAGPGLHAEHRDHLGVGGVLEDPTGEMGDDGQPGPIATGLLQEPAALLALGVVEPVRDRRACQLVADVVRPRRPLPADDPQGHHLRLPGLVPRGEEVTDGGIKDLLERGPRDVEVVVHLPQGHGGDHRVQGGPVAAVHQEHPLQRRVLRMSAGEELQCRRPGHALVDEEQGHRVPRRPQGVGGIGRPGPRDGVVAPEPPLQIGDETAQQHRIVGHHEEARA